MFAFNDNEKSPYILQLNQEEKRCIDALLAASKQREEEKQQAYAKYFEELGDIFAQRGEILQDTRQQLKAIALYNLVLASQLPQSQADRLYECSPILFLSLNQTQICLVVKIKQIEDKLIRTFGDHVSKENLEEYWQKIEEAKGILRKIRQRAQNELALVEKKEITVQAIYQHIADGLKQGLLKQLISECFQVLPLPQGCIYSLMALGSLARSEATPFSDFEFGILIEDQGEERNNIHKEYFRKLAYLLWIKILNLRETTTRMMDISFLEWMQKEERSQYDNKFTEIEWLNESASPCRKGFSLDGQMEQGCHTPLGNAHHSQRKLREIHTDKTLEAAEKKKQLQEVKSYEYELLGTPNELARFQTDEWFKKKHALTTVLSTITSIIGNDQKLKINLEQKYKEEVAKVLDKPIAGTDKTCIQMRSLNLLAESCEKFKFRGGKFEKDCHYYDAKYHLYRLPNMLLDHLATYFGVKENNLWQRIVALFSKGSKLQNESGLKNLTGVVSDILMLRLASYLRKGYREDHIITFSSDHPNENSKLLNKYLGIEQAEMFQIYAVLISLQYALERFIQSGGQENVLIEENYFDEGPFIRGFIYNLLLDYEQAIKAYKEAESSYVRVYGRHDVRVAAILNNIGKIYIEQGNYSEAIRMLEKAKQIFAEKNGEHHISLAESLSNLGEVYIHLGRYHDAICMFEKVKNLYSGSPQEKHIAIAGTYNDLGSVYRELARYKDAIQVFEEAKGIYVQAYTSQHPSVASIYNNLGLVHRDQGHFSEAINAFGIAGKILTDIHGKFHTSVAATLINIGNIKRVLGHFSEAISLFEVAKEIYIKVHGRKHILVATALSNLGNVYLDQKFFPKAIGTFKEAKNISCNNSLLKASILTSLGAIYRLQFRYKKAIVVYEQVKSIYCNIKGDQHPFVASIINNLGNIYSDQYLCPEAIQNYEVAKRLYQISYGERHPLLGDTYNNIGLAYIQVGQFESARKYFIQAIKMFKEFEHRHEKTASENLKVTYIREGNKFLIDGNIEMARICYNKANVTLSPEMVSTHQELANNFYDLNELSAVREHFYILTQLSPEDAAVHHDLGCFTHVYAQIEKEKGNEASYKSHIEEVERQFQRALQLNAGAALYVEYSQFMMLNRSQYQIAAIIDNLLKAIEMDMDEEGVGYGKIERLIVDPVLQNMIDEENRISFKGYLLAYYLLMNAYILAGQIPEAMTALGQFKIKVDSCQKEYDNKANQSRNYSFQAEAHSSDDGALLAEETELRFIRKLLKMSSAILDFVVQCQNTDSLNKEEFMILDYTRWSIRLSDGQKYLPLENKVIPFKVYVYGCYILCLANLFNGQDAQAQQLLSFLKKEMACLQKAAYRRKLIYKLQVLSAEVQVRLQKIVKAEKGERELIKMILEASLPPEGEEKANSASSSISSAFSLFTPDTNSIVFKSSEGTEKRSETSNERKQKIPSAEPGFSSPFWQPPIQREGLHTESQVKAWLLGKVPNHLRLGKAISRGDCFFDAVAQGINQLSGKEGYDTKSLRLLCDEYANDNKNSWIKAANKRDREEHEQYLVSIQFTAQEMEEKERQGLKLGTAIWGRPKIEGRIFCEQFNIRLHIIEIQEDGSIHRFLVDKEGEKEEVNPQVDYNDLRIIHLVNYHNHYVPLLSERCFEQGLVVGKENPETPLKQVNVKKELSASKLSSILGLATSHHAVEEKIAKKIFRLFDAATLRSAKLVNKRWYEVIQEVEKANGEMRPF